MFYAGVGGFSSPQTLAYDEPGANQQFRIDLVAPSAPIDSVAHGDVLVNVFKTSAGDPDRREPSTVSVDVSRWAGQTVRLRLAVTDNGGPLRAGVDDIRFEPIGADANARIELPHTEQPARALNLVLHRMTEADALKALSARADKLAGEDEFSGAVLVAKDDRVLFSHAYGLADRNRRIPNTIRTRFRIGSMNKMFTAVAILQLVEAGKVKLTAPLGTYLPDYPNRDVATKVTIHQLLTHTGGTGDIFGPDFDAHRNELRTLADYVKLYGKRGPEFEPGSQLGVQQLRLHPARRRDRKGHRAQLLRLRAATHLRARGDDPQRIAARRPSGPRPVDRIHQATRNDRAGSRTPTRCPTAEPPPAAATRPSGTSHASPTPCSATNCSAPTPPSC